MEPSESPELPESDGSRPDAQPDRLESLEARMRALEERIPATQLLDRRFLPRAFAVLGHYFVAGLIIYVIAIATILSLAAIGGSIGSIMGRPDSISRVPGEPAVHKGPRLNSVASLPVNAAGVGTIQGTPTGEATYEDDRGSFVLVLYPAPAGLPARTTLDVAFDRSTKVFRGTHMAGDPLTAASTEHGTADADPSAAGTVVVQFRIKNGRVFADRLDLSDETPPGCEP